MDRWVGRVAMVTGASAGIGEAIARSLVKAGMRVVGLARRLEKLESIAKDLENESGKFYPVRCDVTKENDIEQAIKWIHDNVGGADVLINNAGIYKLNSLLDSTNEDLKEIINTNLLSVSIFAREVIKSMRSRKVDDGHIIFINSVSGHYVPRFNDPILNIYPATKHAITALVETVRQELTILGSNIKVSSLSPGYVETQIKNVFGGPALQPKDCVDAVLYMLGTPPNVQVTELTLRPVREPF